MMTALERSLNSVGKRCFVEYYEDFKNCIDKESLANRLLDENNSANSKQAQITRINCALSIFESQLDKEALKIILSSKRVDSNTKIKAEEILRTSE